MTSTPEQLAKQRERNRRYYERKANDPAYKAARAESYRRYVDKNREALLARRAARRAEKKAEAAATRLAHRTTGNSPDEFFAAASRRAEWRRELGKLRRLGLAPPAPAS